MGEYDFYFARLNRYGDNLKDRIQGQREKEFESKKAKSVYRVEFEYQYDTYEGTLEKYKQDETRTLQYLLTDRNLFMKNGAIIEFGEKPTRYMVYYLEEIEASGYNKYILLKMTHWFEWTDRQGIKHSTYAYMYGQEDNMLMDEIRSRSRMDTIYAENLKSSFFILPIQKDLKKDDYIIINFNGIEEYYRVTGYDVQSSEGVEYVTVDPIYEYDLTPAPEKTAEDADSDFFWLRGE